MAEWIAVGASAELSRRVTRRELVAEVFPDTGVFQAMPPVLATAYMIGLMELACVEQIAPHYAPGQGSVGTHVDVSHIAPTAPGSRVRVASTITAIEGKSIWFEVTIRDEAGVIGEGRHRRALVDWAKFDAKLAERSAAGSAA